METITLRPIGRLFVAGFLLGTALFAGCAQQQSVSETNNQSSFRAPQTINKTNSLSRLEKKANGKTSFHFDAAGPITLAAHEQTKVTVLYSPTYEGVSAIEVVIKYDPASLSVSELHPAKGVIPFQSMIDTQAGTIVLVAAVDPNRFGNRLEAFSFTVTAKPAEQPTESVLTFDPTDLHALLPDVANTDTAVRENLPRLVFSLR